jgi:hypothetical protein
MPSAKDGQSKVEQVQRFGSSRSPAASGHAPPPPAADFPGRDSGRDSRRMNNLSKWRFDQRLPPGGVWPTGSDKLDPTSAPPLLRLYRHRAPGMGRAGGERSRAELSESGDWAEYGAHDDETYDSYAACVAMAGGRRVPVTLRPNGDAFGLDLDELRAAVTPRTRLILLNTPHNPTGTVLSREELAAVAELAVERDLLVVTDEVYEHLVFDGEQIPLARPPACAGGRSPSARRARRSPSPAGRWGEPFPVRTPLGMANPRKQRQPITPARRQRSTAASPTLMTTTRRASTARSESAATSPSGWDSSSPR